MADARIETNAPGPSPSATPINPHLPSLAEIQTIESPGAPSQSDGGSPQTTSNVVVDPLGLEPVAKRRKFETNSQINEKLEHRLGGILCCAVCLDLPKIAVYQVIQIPLIPSPLLKIFQVFFLLFFFVSKILQYFLTAIFPPYCK